MQPVSRACAALTRLVVNAALNQIGSYHDTIWLKYAHLAKTGAPLPATLSAAYLLAIHVHTVSCPSDLMPCGSTVEALRHTKYFPSANVGEAWVLTLLANTELLCELLARVREVRSRLLHPAALCHAHPEPTRPPNPNPNPRQQSDP